MLFFSRFFLLQKDFEIQKTKTIFYVSSSASKSFFFDACSHERRRRRRRRRRQKRTRPAKNHLSSFRGGGGGGGGQKAASPSRLRIENSPPFLRRHHRVGIHTHKKREEEISLRSFRFEGHTHTTTRETDCSSHITCVFRGVCDDEEVARPKRKAEEACVCDTADDLFKDAALVCMTLSLSSTADDERRACFLCRRRRERFFFRST